MGSSFLAVCFKNSVLAKLPHCPAKRVPRPPVGLTRSYQNVSWYNVVVEIHRRQLETHMSIKALQEAVAYALLNKNDVMAAALQAALDRLTK